MSLENRVKLAPVVVLAYLNQAKAQESYELAKLGKEQALELGLPELVTINTAIANTFNQPPDINNTITELSFACESYPERWVICNLLANTLFSEQRFTEAANVLENILEKKPNHTLLVVKLADSYVRAEDTENAELYVYALLKKYPKQPYVNLLAATLELKKENFNSALNYINSAMNSGLTSPQAKLIASLVNYQLGSNEQAMNHLRSLKSSFPDNPLVTKLYIAIQLRLGDTDSITEAYSDARASKDNSEIFALAGLELLKSGKSVKSAELLQKIDTSMIENQQILNTVSLAKLSTGDSSGIIDLENSLTRLIENKAPTQEITKVKVLLISSLLALDNIQKAEVYVNSWISSNPKSITNKLLLVQLERRKPSPDDNKIQKIYHSVLLTDEYNLVANLYFTNMFTKLGEYSSAEKYINKAIEKHENNITIAKSYLNVQEQLIGKDKAFNQLISRYANYEDSFETRLVLAQIYLIENQAEKVIELLATAQVPSHIEAANVKIILADANMTIGQFSNAIAIYQSLITKDVLNDRVIKNLALAYEKSNNVSEAVTTFEQLHLEYPANTQIGLLLSNFYIFNKQPELSIKYIETLTAEQQNHPIVSGLKGKAYYFSEQCSKALPLLASSYQVTKNGKLMPYIFDCHIQNNNKIEATRIMEQHILEHPKETASRIYYANELHKYDKQSAIVQYKEVIAEDKKNILALNNIAWLLYEAGELDKAKKYIDIAIKLAPENPDVRDTLDKITQALNK